MEYPPTVVVSEEVKAIAEGMGMTYSEVYDEIDRLYTEQVHATLRPVFDLLLKREIAALLQQRAEAN